MRGYYDAALAFCWLQFGVFSPINRLFLNAFNSKEPWFYFPAWSVADEAIFTPASQLTTLSLHQGDAWTRDWPFGSAFITTIQTKAKMLMRVKINISLVVNHGGPTSEALDPVYHSASVSVWFCDGASAWFLPWLKYAGKGAMSLELARIIRSLVRAGAVIPMDAHPQTGGRAPRNAGLVSFPRWTIVLVLLWRRRR